MPNVPTAVTTPVDEPIVAMLVLLLTHVPPEVVSLNPVVNPEQTIAVPEIAGGEGLTVNADVAMQPVPSI